MACPACGLTTPADARFCPACGERLLGGADERRVVTVLFARLAAEVRRFGGTLEKHIGDAIFAVFGFPTGHDDDPVRAVRAALALRDIVKTAETALGDVPLHLRIGLDTGEVAAAGMAATDPAGVLATTIGRLVAETSPDPLAAPTTTEALCRLADLEPDEPGLRSRPHLTNARELAAALAGVLCGLASNERVLVVLEDLDWATSDLLEVASTLVADGCQTKGQLAYLGICRPELPGLPAWLLRTGTQRIDLGPLGERPAGELLGSILGTDADREQAELRLDRGTVRGATGDLSGAPDDLGRATGASRTAVRAQAWTELSKVHVVFGQFAESAAAADRAIVEAVEAGDLALIAQAIRVKAYPPYLAGDLTGPGRLLDEAILQARRAGQARLVIELRASLPPMRLYLATPLDLLRAEALGLIEDARGAGRRSAEASAQVSLGEVAWLQDDPDAAERHFAESNRFSLEIGFTRKRLWSLLGLVLVAIARAETARRRAQEAIELTTEPDGTADVEAELHLAEVLQEVDVLSRARLQRTEARLASASGDPAAAVTLLERSLAALETTDHRLDQLHSLVELGPALRCVGRDDEADAVAKRALDQATTMGAHALVRRLAREGVGR